MFSKVDSAGPSVDEGRLRKEIALALLRQTDRTREVSGALAMLQRYRALPDSPFSGQEVSTTADEIKHLREMTAAVTSVAAADTASSSNMVFAPPDVEAVAACMREHVCESDGHIEDLRVIVGGYSKQTCMFDWIGADGTVESYVLRRDCPPGIVGSSVIDEYPLLASLYRLGQPVPEPVYVEEANPRIAMPFIITRRLPGCSIGGPMGPGDDRSFDPTPGLAKMLARLHAVSVRDLRIPQYSDRAFDRDILSARIGYWRDRYLANRERRSPTLDATIAFLETEIESGLQPGVVVHGDPGFYNLLFEDGDVVGVVDWELAHLGSAAWDLAYAKEGVKTFCSYEEFLRLYEHYGGLLPSPKALAYYDVFRLFYSCTMCVSGVSMFNRGEAVGLDLLQVLCTMYPRYVEQLPPAMEAFRGAEGSGR